MNFKSTVLVFTAMTIAGCESDPTLQLPGLTEWDRNVVLAESSEPVLEWFVAEGDAVSAGDLLLRLDSARQDSRIAEAESRLAEAGARLQELVSGPREQTIARARAELASAAAAMLEAELAYDRAAELLNRNLTSESNVDQTRAARDEKRAARAAAEAGLDELLAGTRHEQLAQARAHVAALEASLEELRITRSRLDVRAPRAGRVDALPFKPGDQPRAGDALVSLLVGPAPIARIFIPADVRAQLAIGDGFTIHVQGLDREFSATLRSLRNEASFTPYYALTGDDASRLVYRAELVFADSDVAALPAGLALVATPTITRPTADWAVTGH